MGDLVAEAVGGVRGRGAVFPVGEPVERLPTVVRLMRPLLVD